MSLSFVADLTDSIRFWLWADLLTYLVISKLLISADWELTVMHTHVQQWPAQFRWFPYYYCHLMNKIYSIPELTTICTQN